MIVETFITSIYHNDIYQDKQIHLISIKYLIYLTFILFEIIQLFYATFYLNF
jgi:hypothetical protein